MVGQRALAAVVLVLAGCSFEPDYADGYRCAPDLPCPDGTTCVDGACRAEGAPIDAADVLDATPDDVFACAGAIRFEERFDELSSEVWSSFSNGGAVIIKVSDGDLVIEPPGPSSNGGVRTQATYNLIGSAITVEAPAPTVTGENWQSLEVADGEISVLILDRYRNNLQVLTDDGTVTAAQVPWSRDNHRYWRFQVSESGVKIATASAAGEWDQLASVALAVPSQLELRLAGGNYESVDPPVIQFGDVLVCAEE